MKKVTFLFFSFFLMLFFTSGAFAQTMDSAAVKPFNDGLDKMQKADYKGALADFDEALKVEKDYRIYYQMGVAQEKLNNPDEAIKEYKNTIKVKPDFEAAYNDLGNVYFNTGKYQDAIDNFQKVLDTSKNDTLKNAVKFNMSLAYTNLGQTADKSKNYKKAIEYLKKAVSYNDYDAAYLFLARDYFLVNQYDNTIKASENALKYRKMIGEGGPYYYMGVAYSKKNDMKKAKEFLEKAKADPVYAKVAETVLSSLK
ncbi:MAG: tetratricopeptide repeat protein [Ignavibacteriaceae bacterium]